MISWFQCLMFGFLGAALFAAVEKLTLEFKKNKTAKVMADKIAAQRARMEVPDKEE